MLSFAVDALAAHRLTKLIVDDEITADLRKKWFEHFGDPQENKMSFLITCPWCAGMWVGFGVVAARTIAPNAWGKVAHALAFSSITGLIEEQI